MKRLLIRVTLGLTCLVFCVGVSPGKKKPPEKPVQERFEATISTPAGGAKNVSIAIGEFSTDQEIQDLAQTYARGGEGAIEKALGKSNKGYFQLQNMDTMPIRLIRLSSSGGVRTMAFVGDVPDHIQGSPYGEISVGHAGFPWTVIQIQIDEQGNGRGLLVFYAKVGLNSQGGLLIQPRGPDQPAKLLNVHLVK